MTEFREWLSILLAIVVPVFSAVNLWFIRKFITEPRQLRADVDALNVRVGAQEKRLESGEEKFRVLDRKMDDHSRDLNEVKALASNIDGKMTVLLQMKHQTDG